MPLKFTILGCGSSMGVPRSDGYFANVIQKIQKILDQDVQLLFKLKLIMF